MEAKVAADPQLVRLAEQHRALGSQLRGAFEPIAAAPVPEYLQAAIRPTAEVIDFAAAKHARRMSGVPQWAALAATLAVGVFVGTMVPKGGGPVQIEGGKMYAAAAVNKALDSQLASASAGNVRIGLTFRNQAGEICRSFTTQASSGLACRNHGHWQLKGLFAAPEGQAGDYRMAAGMDPNLAALVDSTMASEPFGTAQEKAARDKAWR